MWAGTTISWYGLPINGRRVGRIQISNDESFWWGHNEDDEEYE